MYFEPQLKKPASQWEARQIAKGVNKAALYYVEEIVTMDLCGPTFIKICKPTFCYWLVVCMHFNTFCVL